MTAGVAVRTGPSAAGYTARAAVARHAAARRAQGFTLLEVMIAVLVLSLSLTALLQVQTRSIALAGRSRDLTVAVALARAKLIDVEQHLFHQGLQAGDEVQEGDFGDVGHPEVHFRYQVSEITLDLSKIGEAVGSRAKSLGEDKAAAQGEVESVFSSIVVVAEPFIQQIARALRVVDLQVSWPQGRTRSQMDFRALLAQDDYSTSAAGDAARTQREINASGLGSGGQAPAGGASTGASGSSSPATGY